MEAEHPGILRAVADFVLLSAQLQPFGGLCGRLLTEDPCLTEENGSELPPFLPWSMDLPSKKCHVKDICQLNGK
jgi:hypothetical protein